mmetsp:Transcript_11344/g.24406  ORF Transcript_11344/g.24406 Transcript_11344/m.24406 type:complete len:198 (-) Transcript_11344:803-1396(-)
MQDLPYIVEVDNTFTGRKTQATVTCEMHLWNGSTMNIDNFTTTTFNIRALPLLINTTITVEEFWEKQPHLIGGIHPKLHSWVESLPTNESLHRNGSKIRDTFEFMLNSQWILHLQQQQMNNSNNRSSYPIKPETSPPSSRPTPPISYLAFSPSYPTPSNPSPIPPFASNNESKNPIPISKNPLSITHGQNAAPFADY